MVIIEGKYYITPHEAAQILGVSRRTVLRWLGANGTGPFRSVKSFTHPMSKVNYLELKSVERVAKAIVEAAR